jgi:UDP-N-acetylmuramoyl-tripeptide--D-alanyl-D-alanine ligase
LKFLLLVPYLFFAARRVLTYLHFFQQEEYDNLRFLHWLRTLFAFDRRASAALLLLGLVRLTGAIPDQVALWLPPIVFIVVGVMEKDPRRVGKKRLMMTSRAKRIFATTLVLLAAIGTVVIATTPNAWTWIAAVQIVPVMLVVANLLLRPYENRLQSRFWNEAHSKLLLHKPLIIGITGSYGKTSVKHILGHILETHAPTLITPGSVNTPMGVARVVREQLRPDHRFFVCEMGAYGPGSIERLCRLAPPDLGIITAIGAAHYERFKNLDTVARTKFELAEAVVKKNGKLVIPQELTAFKNAADFVSSHTDATIMVGTGDTAALRIISSKLIPRGIQLEVLWQGCSYTVKAPIYGDHHSTNIALAFAAACELGLAPEDVVLALESMPQISHRLEVKWQPNGIVLIDDAYNSNPVGFANALQLIDLLQKDGGRRILVTPGMVELGEVHAEEHRRVGKLAATHVDILLPVVPERIKDLTDSYRAANPAGVVIPCPSYAAASDWLSANSRAGDVILLENDLPDLYEDKPRL